MIGKRGIVYIITNKNNTTLYTGVTSDLTSRLIQHIDKCYTNSITTKYNINKLVYFESFETIEEAIEREKQIKTGSRLKKVKLIDSINENWKDLGIEVLQW